MKINEITINDDLYPAILRTIPAPPKKLYCLGAPLSELLQMPAVAIVGCRRITPYGHKVTVDMAGGLADHGVVVISGLALGVDCVAQRAALDHGGKVIAVMPNGLDRICPATNRNLAKRILEQRGTIITEYPLNTEPFKSNFVARNRIVTGLAKALLITEAAEKSGTLHTANFALEQGREVCVVPGNINSPYSVGTNNLIKSGATPVTSVNDVLQVIGISEKRKKKKDIVASSKEEYIILTLINDGLDDGEELLKQSGLDASVFNQTLTMLEITGRIVSIGGGRWNIN